jgi:3-oxoacyl-[acyl-carrier protein] reductase
LSNGARSGLTGFVAGLARQPRLASRNVTINNVLPGAFDTERLRGITAAAAKSSGQDFAAAMAQRKQSNPTRDVGQADDFGVACAFFCSVHTRYITGQNLVLDGGDYPGTF